MSRRSRSRRREAARYVIEPHVSLTIATKHEHVPIDFARYMPKSWTDDASRHERPEGEDAALTHHQARSLSQEC
jgi:DDE superfamily endonuclease